MWSLGIILYYLLFDYTKEIEEDLTKVLRDYIDGKGSYSLKFTNNI